MASSHSRLTAIVLGSGAGGGVPQWNCGCRLCTLARAKDPRIRPATQVSVAASANGSEWLLVGASPDLRQQILQTPALWPRGSTRNSPITAVVLTGGDIDAIAGLLVLRENHRFTIYAPPSILDLLAASPVFNVLDRRLVERVPVLPDQPVTAAGLRVTLLPLPGKIPLYLEDPDAAQQEAAPAYAARLEADGRSIIVASACARITPEVHEQLGSADVLFFDGTLFQDDEMIAAGLSQKTGRRMGHVSLSGPDGALALLRDLRARRILLHINNTNPMLLADSPERRQTEAAGFEIAYDGMEVRL